MTTYYIDYKNGNDGNTGGSGDPLKTLTHALTHVANNDTVLCRGSDASDEIYREYAGTTVRTGLTIAADTGHTPTFTPATEYTVWALTAGQSFTYETAFAPAACWYCFNGATKLTVKASIAEVEATADTFYADVVGDKLYVHIAGGGAPTAINAWATVTALLTSAGANITYSGLRCQWCGEGFQFDAAGTVIDCTVRYHGGDYSGGRNGIKVNAAAVVSITNCTISGQFAAVGSNGTNAIVKFAAATLTITGCAISYARYGVYENDRGGSTTITDCTFSHCEDAISIQAAANATTATVSTCTFTETGHSAVQLTGAAVTGTITNCVAYKTAGGIRAYTNCYITESSATGIWYNCLVVTYHIGFYVLASGVATVKNCGAVECDVGFNQSAGTALAADYNGAYNNTADYAGTAPWSPGAHDVAADPLFLDAATYDYHLTAPSPWRDAGVDVGLPFSGPVPDIGPFEYTAQGRHHNKSGLLSSGILTS